MKCDRAVLPEYWACLFVSSVLFIYLFTYLIIVFPYMSISSVHGTVRRCTIDSCVINPS
jgi:hypothetical protein